MEIWDGYYRDGSFADIDLIRGEKIPIGIYHLVCEVLVKHKDSNYLLMQRDWSKKDFGGFYEATAGGSALKGEDKIACIKRELWEETGIMSNEFEELEHFIFDDDNCIFHIFLCVADCDKKSITLQQGETMSYKWVNEQKFKNFINSGKMIETQRKRFLNYFVKKGFIATKSIS